MPSTRRLGQPSVTLDDIRHFRQLDSKAPGHPEYHLVSGVETTTGPLGQGIATSVGMAIAQKWLAARYNQPGFDDLRLQHLRGLRRRLPDGGRRLGGGLARRPSRPRQPLLDLRQQPHHDRRQHAASPSPRTSRRASWATAGTCCASATPTTSSASSTRCGRSARRRAGPRSSSSTATSATARRTGRTRPRRTASRSARRRSGSPSAPTAGRRTRSSWCPTASASTSRPASARAARDAHRQVERALRGLPRASIRSSPTEIEQMQRRELPGRLGPQPARSFPADAKGIAGRDASGKVLNVLAQNIPWFLGGSADLGPSNKTTLTFEGAGDFQAGTPGRQEPALRHPRARDGRDRERPVAVEAAAVRRDVLHLQRLRAAGDPALGADGAADALRVHARRDGRRRGRPDAPAGRAARVAARDARAVAAAARRRQRGGRGVPLRHAAAPPAGGAGAVAPAAADARPHASTRRRPASRTAPTCSPTRRAASPR